MYLYSINTMVYCHQSHFQTDVHCTQTDAFSLAEYTFPLPNQVKSNQAEWETTVPLLLFLSGVAGSIVLTIFNHL